MSRQIFLTDEQVTYILDAMSADELQGLLAKKLERENELFMRSAIEELDLSVRAYHALKDNGMNSLQDVLNTGLGKIGTFDNVGKTTLKEIDDKIFQKAEKIRLQKESLQS